MQKMSFKRRRYELFDTSGRLPGGNARAWFLRIVRNTCSGWRGDQVRAAADLFDEERHNTEGPVNGPGTLLIQADVSSRSTGDTSRRGRCRPSVSA
jgi:DNA-directed RNA polymerase specialized sigma24 family protein